MLGASEGEVARPRRYVEPNGAPEPEAVRDGAQLAAGIGIAILVTALVQIGLIAALAGAVALGARVAHALR